MWDNPTIFHRVNSFGKKILRKYKYWQKLLKKTLTKGILKNIRMSNGCMTENIGWLLFRGGSRTAATSKMECFVIIVNGLLLLSKNAPS